MNKFLLFLIILLQLGALGSFWYVYLQKTSPQNRYFATTENGRLVPVPRPLNLPSVKDAEILYINPMILEEVFTVDHKNYREKLNILSQFFTRRGWETFTQTLQKQNFEQTIVNDKSAVMKSVAGNTEIIKSGLINGRYQWEIMLPMKTSIQSETQKDFELDYKLKVMLVRVPRLESFKGIGVELIEVVND